MNKQITFVSIAIFCAAISYATFISLNSPEKSLAHQNLIDRKISLRSSTEINEGATEADARFSKIAFAEPSRPSFSNEIASVIKAVKFSVIKPEIEYERDSGTWLWSPVLAMNREYMKSIVSGAKSEGVNVIYLSVDSYLDIFAAANSKEKEKNKNEFSKKIEEFIAIANDKGISVDAEAGWRNWAEAGNEYKAFAVVNFVKNFNATHEKKFRGFQYDIEPYLLDSYEKDKGLVLRNFVELVDKTENFIGGDMQFSVVVPDFYDKEDAATPKFSYNGKDDYVFGHLLNILDKKPDNSIVIMSYRNFAEGDDGSIGVSKNEMRTGSGNHQTKIIIAQETGNVPPSYITFHNTSKKYLWGEISKINSAFSSYPNFGGIAIHYVNAFLAMK